MYKLASTDYLLFKNSPIHGMGAFARTHIPNATRVIEYVGEMITKEESARRCELNNEYIFSLDEERDIDGNVPWNPARLINHSCEPNCEALAEEGQIWVVAIRDIVIGEEITFNYGFDLAEYKNYPCLCGSPNCARYIVAEAFFEHVRMQSKY